MPLWNPAINRDATRCLDDGFEGSASDLLSGTSRNEKDIVWLQIDIRRFCCQNVLQRYLCLLWRAFRFRLAYQLSSVESGVGTSPLRHCVCLENRHARVLHDKPPGQ